MPNTGTQAHLVNAQEPGYPVVQPHVEDELKHLDDSLLGLQHIIVRLAGRRSAKRL